MKSSAKTSKHIITIYLQSKCTCLDKHINSSANKTCLGSLPYSSITLHQINLWCFNFDVTCIVSHLLRLCFSAVFVMAAQFNVGDLSLRWALCFWITLAYFRSYSYLKWLPPSDPSCNIATNMASQAETGNVHLEDVRSMVSKTALYELDHHTFHDEPNGNFTFLDLPRWRPLTNQLSSASWMLCLTCQVQFPRQISRNTCYRTALSSTCHLLVDWRLT